MCRMEAERGCRASDSSKAGNDGNDCAIRWTVEEVSKQKKLLYMYIKPKYFFAQLSHIRLLLLQISTALLKVICSPMCLNIVSFYLG